jgi:hypothetical protein
MEKATRLKLGSGNDLFSTFEALEFLTLGILGKEALWRALKSAAPSESRLRGYDFNSLAVRAHTQYEKVEQQRLAFAGVVFKQGSFR